MAITSPLEDAVPVVPAEKIYAEIRAGIRETDSISFKLLGLVPLVSGTALIGIVLQTRDLPPGVVVLLALFASMITLGLFRWELRNVQTCTWLIKYADALEAHALKEKGIAEVFPPRPKPPQRVGKAEAEKLMYATTISAWLALPVGMDALPLAPYREAYFFIAGVILAGTVISLFAKARVQREGPAVENMHERTLLADARRVGALLDSLGSPQDRLWPQDRWPAMRFDRPLQVGAIGGHGPIRYIVERYKPGRAVWFRLTEPAGFEGGHGFDLEPTADGGTRFRHLLTMDLRGSARASWPLIFRPLHDALVEDVLDSAAVAVGDLPYKRAWSLWVRVLRATLRRRSASRHKDPMEAANQPSDDPLFRDAVQGLVNGDFSRLEPLFIGDGGRKSPIILWHEECRFRDEPKALAEALTCACFLGRAGVAQHLLRSGIDPSAGAGTGLNAFHWAANRGQVDAVRLLLRWNAPLGTRNMYGGNVLDTAVWSAINEPRSGQLEVIEQLLAAGARLEREEYPTGNADIDALLRKYQAV